MSEAWYRDVAAIFVAVLLAEITVLLAQAVWPMLAERVRVQQEAWGKVQWGAAEQVSEQEAAG